MTGFATTSQNIGNYTLSVLIRAVNHRFFDVTIRTPEALRALEPLLRERMASRLRRGKVDCQVQLTRRADIMEEPKIQLSRVKTLLDAEKHILEIAPAARPLSCSEILRYEGVMSQIAVETEAETLSATAMETFDRAWEEFATSREREGAKLAEILRRCCDDAEALARQCKPRAPLIYAAYKERLIAWVKEAGATVDETRLTQEVALYAAKIDVAEEIDRLLAHVTEVRRVLGAGAEQNAPLSGIVTKSKETGSSGKRLDFLAQELHREANTLGSKSTDLILSQIALELKVTIEQMREQVQNIE